MDREPFLCHNIDIVLPKNDALTKRLKDNQEIYQKEKEAYILIEKEKQKKLQEEAKRREAEFKAAAEAEAKKKQEEADKREEGLKAAAATAKAEADKKRLADLKDVTDAAKKI